MDAPKEYSIPVFIHESHHHLLGFLKTLCPIYLEHFKCAFCSIQLIIAWRAFSPGFHFSLIVGFQKLHVHVNEHQQLLSYFLPQQS